MALIDKLFDLEDTSVFKKNYQKVGGTNTELGEFQVKQGDNTGRDSKLTEKKSDLQLKEEPPRSLPPEVKGRQQALEAVEDVGVEKTALFIGKQALLHRFNAQEDTKVYDPTALAQNLVVPTDNFIDGKLFGGHEEEDVDVKVGQGISYVKPGDNQKLGINVVLNKDKTPTSRQKGKIKITSDDVSYNMRNIKDSSNDGGATFGKNFEKLSPNDLPEDFIKFRIKDQINKRIIQFPAYLTDITDNSSAEYNPTRYIGRADQVFVYTGYSRSISFGFRVAALTRGDVPVMWNKIDHLKQLALPTYKTDVLDDGEPRPVAPFVDLTIGDLYVDQPGYFSGINLTIPQSSNWETEDGYQLTHLCDISLEFTYVGKGLPQNRREGEVGTPQFDMKEIK